jgi:hypothetical protein
VSQRWYCVLSPCIPLEVERPEAYGGMSFSTREAWERHVRKGHFLEPGAPGVPEAYVLTRIERFEEAV